MQMPIVNLEFSGDPPSIYCPVCATLILGPDPPPTCEHVLFSMIHEIGEFNQVAPHLQTHVDSVTEQAEEEGLDPEDMVAELLQRMDSKSVLSFSVTTSGVACGPASTTVYVAVDFNR